MANSKIVISKIEHQGYFTSIFGVMPTADFTEIQAYFYKYNEWEPMGTSQNYDTVNFMIRASTTPAGGGKCAVVVCLQEHGSPPNASCSDPFIHDFPDFG
jgi:hypothetical protein